MKNTLTKITTILLAAGSLLPQNSRAQSMAGGINFSHSVCTDNSVMAWGYNGEGQLGDSTHTDNIVPGDVNGLTGVIAVSSGGAHTLALKSDGTIWAWGYNVYSSLGSGIPGGDRDTATKVVGLTNVIAISAGGYHSLALKSDGTVWSWGSNVAGEIGDGTTSTRATPVLVTGISGIVAISAGDLHSFALKNDGTLYAWGFNSNGRLGDGTTTNRYSPVVASITGVAKICGAGYHSLAMKTDGTVWAWGKNDSGQLGDGTYTDRSLPVQIIGLTGVTALEGGEEYSMVLKSDGTVWAWGRNNSGQLGDGTTTGRNTPAQVTGLNGVNSIAAGYKHALALKNDGTLWGWGADGSGQLGDGNTSNKTTPVQATGLCSIAVTGIADAGSNMLDFNVYPNPANGIVQIQLPQIHEALLRVINVMGQEIFTKQIGTQEQVDLTALPNGIYFLQVSAAGASGTKRIIVQK